ncbi:MAG: hypothetical protein VB141_08540, partial [Burkholderia gladioli]
MRSLPWAMPFGLNALLLHFDLETALYYACFHLAEIRRAPRREAGRAYRGQRSDEGETGMESRA